MIRKEKEIMNMAAKGTQTKIEVGNIILEAFDDAFWNGEGKEIRVNMVENGEPIQVKIALTVAKTPVEPGAADAIPGATPKKTTASATVAKGDGPSFPEPKETETVELTDKEKDAVANLMAELGL